MQTFNIVEQHDGKFRVEIETVKFQPVTIAQPLGVYDTWAAAQSAVKLEAGGGDYSYHCVPRG
jgi:hypothetical protein